MKKELKFIIAGLVLIGIVCIWFLAQNKSNGQVVVDHLNEAISNYTDMNMKNDQTYSLKVSDTQMLVRTYMPEFTILGVSTDQYTVRPSQIEDTLTTENEQDLPICNFNNLLLYDEKTDKFYNVKFEEKGKPVIPKFTKAKELYKTIYELDLPNKEIVESITLKENSDSQIVLSNKDDVETILNILQDTKSTTKRSQIGTPIRVDNIINIDFICKEDVISRLFLFEDQGEYFMEQPYNGVYQISNETYNLIENYVKDH